ncbi:MAG: hypothetical protein ACTSV7_03145 [Candidatus Baldrarchaeia archaeon]
MSYHVAIKCTYNNGDEGVFVGFNGTCSEDIIKWNIESGRVWCSHKNCECRKYYDRGFKGKRPVDPCYESVLFRDWKYGAGWYHRGKRAETPIHLSKVAEGKIAILTTRFPNDQEKDRKIIGFFKIGQIINVPEKETIMIADAKFRLRLPMEEVKHLYFWDYYSTRGGIRWGTGLIRYLNDEQVVSILTDLRKTIRDEKAKAMIDELLVKDFSGVPTKPPSGDRIKISGDRTRRVAIERKYGSGGEGEEHKKLKEWIAQNPMEIGLTNVKKPKIEYPFISGDVADIVFELEGGKYAVVEVETVDPYPGAHQALKYKVLKCAELGLDIKSPNVEAILVAWSIPQNVKDFCNKYGIRIVEKKL